MKFFKLLILGALFSASLSFANSLKVSNALNFSSKALSSLYSVTNKHKAFNFNGWNNCSVLHSEFEVKKVSNLFDLENVEDIKSYIFKMENKNRKYWKEKYGLSLKESKLYSFENFIRSTLYPNLNSLVDSIYCFQKLGRDLNKSKARKEIISKLNSTTKNLSIFVYYEDGFDSESSKSATRLISIYLLDKSKKEFYALKGTERF